MDILREKANALLKTNKLLRKEISDHYRAEFIALLNITNGDIAI